MGVNQLTFALLYMTLLSQQRNCALLQTRPLHYRYRNVRF
jgi:hypothetical protein